MLNARVRQYRSNPKFCTSCHRELIFLVERNQFYCTHCQLATTVIGPGGKNMGKGSNTNRDVRGEELKELARIIASGKVTYPSIKPFVLRLVPRPKEKK